MDILRGTTSGAFIHTCCHTVVQQYLLLETSRRDLGDSCEEDPIDLLFELEGI